MNKLPKEVPAFYSEDDFIDFCKDLEIPKEVIKKLLEDNELIDIDIALEEYLITL